VICSSEYEQSDWELTRSFQSEKLRTDPWGFQQRGWLAPTEIDINDGGRQLFNISSAPMSGVWDWTAVIETVIDIATPC